MRPFEARDEAQVYALAAKMYEEEIEAPMGLCDSDREVVGDKRVGAYLTLSPDYCFVVENMSDGSIVAFALTSPDPVQFYTKHNSSWLPEMRSKYPKKIKDVNGAMLSPIEEMSLSFHLEEEVNDLPSCLTAVVQQQQPAATAAASTSAVASTVAAGLAGATAVATATASAANTAIPWGQIQLFIATSVLGDQSVSKRLAMLAMACLRASGTIRAFAEVKSRDLRQKDLYSMLGFSLVMTSMGILGNGLLNSESSCSPTESTASTSTTSAPAIVASNNTPTAKYSYLTRSF